MFIKIFSVFHVHVLVKDRGQQQKLLDGLNQSLGHSSLLTDSSAPSKCLFKELRTKNFQSLFGTGKNILDELNQILGHSSLASQPYPAWSL